MFKFVAASALAATALAAPAITQDLVDRVNAHGTWKAHMSPRFANATIDDVKGLCGTVMPDMPGYFQLPEKDVVVNEDIPSDFDTAENWPECAGVTDDIRDQSACGSCWAFGSTEALNDRMCIASGGEFTTLLSPTDTVACCGFLQCMSMGCGGGQPAAAWSWFTRTGVVTGGDYSDIGSGDTCLPYPFESCAHHVDPTPEYPACPENDYSTPKCVSDCSESGYGTAYADDKRMASTSYSLRGVDKIQTDIMTYGSVTAAFSVYEDFPTYESGVYTHQEGSYLGGHAIKIVGWGEWPNDDGTTTPYWRVNNSWNKSWGDNGQFLILRGENECGIEGSVCAGQV